MITRRVGADPVEGGRVIVWPANRAGVGRLVFNRVVMLKGISMGRCCLAALIVGLMVGVCDADEVILRDGSRLIGQVKSIDNGKLVIQTGFAGELTVDVGQVVGVTTDSDKVIQLESGDRAVGPMTFDEGHGQSVHAEDVGQVSTPLDRVTAVWEPGEHSPEQRAAAKLAEEAEPKWTGQLEVGLDGQSGNTEKLGFFGRAEAKRTTPTERTLFFLQGRYSEENSVRSINEIMGGMNMEVDVSDERFVFGRVRLEFDEFENLDMRAKVSGGLGHFFIREDGEELKGRAGIGYQNESFMNGTTEDQAIGELGVDYVKEVAPWLEFTHSTTYYPTFDQLSDFRIAMENAAEFPLVAGPDWRLRVGLRHEYDAMPQGGIDRLDTYYFINMLLGGH